MEIEFDKISKRYKELENNLLKQGRLPMKDTSVGFWSYASSKDVFELFRKIQLSKFNHFLDLGSGDGRVAMIASLFTRSTGIEIDHEMHMIASTIRNELNPNKINLINDDFYNYNISGHDVIFVNPDRPFYRGLENKMLNELKGLLVVYGPHFHPQQLKKFDETFVNETYVGFYTK